MKGGELIENTILVVLVVFVVYVFFIKAGKSSSNKALQSSTVQELLYYKEITPDGLVILPENRYRRVVEIFPTNLGLKSIDEQAMCWEAYRGTIDTLSVDWTKVIQSRIMLMGDYLDELSGESVRLKDKYPLLYEHARQVIGELRAEYEEKEKRERRYFVILKIDGEDIVAMENSFGVDNAAVGAFIGSFGSNKKYSDEELRNIAVSELDNAYALLVTGLMRAGVIARPLLKRDVLDYLNNTLNRDLAPSQNIGSIENAGVFHFSPKSVTVDLFLSKQAVEAYKPDDGAEEVYYEDEEKGMNDSEVASNV